MLECADTIGCSSVQGEKLLGIVHTVEEKKIELMDLSEIRWTGLGTMEQIISRTIVLSSLYSSHLGGSRQCVPPRL